MGFALREGVHYCVANQRVALLDLNANALFCLPPDLDDSFQSWACGDTDQAYKLEPLFDRGILVRTNSEQAPAPCPKLTFPRRTWDPFLAPSPSAPGVLAAVGTQVATMAALKLMPISRLLKRMASRKQAAILRADPTADPKALRALTEMAASRAFVATQDKCVRWSIAMSRHLRGAQAYPELVFGIRLEPFSAHAWVQFEDMILSDTADHAAQYTPLLVV